MHVICMVHATSCNICRINTMMKLYRLACVRHRQFATSKASFRNLHFCSIRNRTNIRLLHSNIIHNRFIGGKLQGCISGINLKLLRCWTSTLAKPELDMNKDVYCMHINTCSELYTKWHDMDVNRKMPLSGVDFDVVYFDSKPRAPSHVPVIVALHGTAGSHLNFEPLIPILMESGARILIPNFPGCGFTKMDEEKLFLHTDQERACFAMDFLNSLGISRVDVLAVHSAAIYPALYCLCDTMFKSIVFLNPAGHKPIKALQPLWLSQIAVSWLNNSLFRPFARLIMPAFAPNMKLGFEQLVIAAKSLVFVNFDFVKQKLKELKLRNFPMVFTYATNDNMVDEKIFDEMTQILEFSPKETVRYDAEGHLVQSQALGNGQQRPPCIIFEDGGHFVMKAYPGIVGKAIVDLLESVTRR